jgi:hypothetical protein
MVRRRLGPKRRSEYSRLLVAYQQIVGRLLLDVEGISANT